MSKYNINADYPELLNEKERALVQKQLSQRSVYLHSVAAETPFGPERSWSLMFVARAGKGVERKCLGVASSAHTGPVSPPGCPYNQVVSG